MLTVIRTLTDDQPSDESRRIWALLNRQCEQAGQTPLNHKRIYTDVAEQTAVAVLHRARS
jgi:hypothetical protein